jgi:Mn2+/Fe2+ NRAMP family transporter
MTNAPAAEFEHLELPKLTPLSLFLKFGPGTVLMMTGIGTSHLVTAPTAGGRFAYALLWCIPVAYIFKYYGFEMAFRFTNATGKSMIEAYGTAWKKWPLWYVLVTTLLQCAVGQAGRLIAASAVLYYFTTQLVGLDIPLPWFGAVLGVVSVAIILRGDYKAVEVAAKAAALGLVFSTLAVYFVQPAPLSAMGRFFIFEAPQGSWLIIAAFLGLLPTGMDVSLQASEWGKAKRVGLGRIRDDLEGAGLARTFDPFSSPKEDLAVDMSRLPSHAREYCRRWYTIGLWDFRVGHVVSFVLAIVFLLLAAVWLYPSPVEGRAVMGEIAGMFTQSVGSWMMVVFLVGALAATYSTAFNYFDGWPRIVGACCRNIFQSTARLSGHENLTAEHRRAWYSEYNIYRMTMVYSLVASVAIIAGIPSPVYLVLTASALAFFVAPIIFFLNMYYCVTVINMYYCVTVIPRDDKAFYPAAWERWFGWVSLFVFWGMSTILILARIFKVPLFGA